MSFLTPSDTNIVMDCPATGRDRWRPELVSRCLPPDDLKRLADCGVGTALEFAPWRELEPKQGHYDWRLCDEQIKRCRAAGLKVLLMGPGGVPDFLPDEWYVKACDGTVMRDRHPKAIVQSWGCLSPWHDEAQAYQNAFIETLCRRYSADDVQVIFSHSQEGESLLPPAARAVYDDAAIASYRRWVGDARAVPQIKSPACQRWLYESLRELVVTQQAIYCQHSASRECWMSLHPVYLGWVGSGVYDVVSYFYDVKGQVKPDSLVWLVFQFFVDAFKDTVWPVVKLVREGLGVEVVTGSEWVDNLGANTPRAIAAGFRALLTSPRHPYLSRGGPLTGPELDAFKDSHRQFMEARA